MEVMKVATVRWLWVMAILWPIGCSVIQPAVPEKILATTPAPDSQPQQASPQAVRPLPPPEIKYLNHKIKWSGENLILIARRIKIGDLILIPEDLLKTRCPMPIEFLSSATDKIKEPAPPPAKQAVKSDKIELFGPIDTETPTSGVDDSDSPLPLETIE